MGLLERHHMDLLILLILIKDILCLDSFHQTILIFFNGVNVGQSGREWGKDYLRIFEKIEISPPNSKPF